MLGVSNGSQKSLQGDNARSCLRITMRGALLCASKLGCIRVTTDWFQRVYSPPQLLELVNMKRYALLPGVHLYMKCVANRAIKCIGIGAFEHHAEVVAVGPVLFRSELLTHALVEPSVRKRVREGNTDVVGTRLADERNSLLNIVPILTQIAELDEVARADAFASQVPTRGDNFFDLTAFFHRVEDLLRAGL